MTKNINDYIEAILTSNALHMEEVNSHKERDYTDEELFILWSTLQEDLGLNGLFNPFELTKGEYHYCMKTIFGEDSGKHFLETCSPSWDTVTESSKRKRYAVEIVQTYKRRGHPYILQGTDLRKTKFELKYLNPDGSIPRETRSKAYELLKKEKKQND